MDEIYGTRRLDSEPEEPDANEEELAEEAGAVITPPPLPEAEEAEVEEIQAPPPLPSEEIEAPVDVMAPPPLPELEEAAAAYESGTVIVTPSPDEEGEAYVSGIEMPSPFEEEEPAVQQPEPITLTPATAATVTPSVTPPIVPPVAPVSTQGAAQPPVKEKKNNTVLIVAIVAAVLLLLCCCCIVIAWALGGPLDELMREIERNLWLGAGPVFRALRL